MVESAELGFQPSEIPAEKQLWMQGRGHVSHHPPRGWERLMVVFVNLTLCAHWSGWGHIDFLWIRFWSFGPQSVWSGWMWWMTSPWVIWQMKSTLSHSEYRSFPCFSYVCLWFTWLNWATDLWGCWRRSDISDRSGCSCSLYYQTSLWHTVDMQYNTIPFSKCCLVILNYTKE